MHQSLAQLPAIQHNNLPGYNNVLQAVELMTGANYLALKNKYEKRFQGALLFAGKHNNTAKFYFCNAEWRCQSAPGKTN